MFDRNKSLGGSDVAAICGLSKYRSGVHVKADKDGEPLEVIDPEDNRFIFWGLRLEDTLREVYAEKAGFKTPTGRWRKGFRIEVPEPKHHPEKPWAHASPDGIVTTPNGKWGLEIKTASEYVKTDWGPEGTDEIPADYMCQVLWYLWVWNLKRWDVCVLIGGNDWRQYTIIRDEDVEKSIQKLVSFAEAWWAYHVVEDNSVPFKGSPADAKAISAMFPTDMDETVTAPEQVRKWVIEAAALHAKSKALKKEFESKRTLITGYMGDAGSLNCDTLGTLTYKAPKPKKTTDWRAVAMALASVLEDPSDIQLEVAKHQTESTQARRFLLSNIKPTGDSDE